MQRQLQNPPEEDSFDMWRDYMNLSKLLEGLRRRPDSLSDTSSHGTSSEYCRLCKQNGESQRVYLSHRLKSDDGKVICPILRKYTCPICKATGDYAHTLRYCRLNACQQHLYGLQKETKWHFVHFVLCFQFI
uniref:Nanos-type domain-containing protein n=1 Tax=Monopterus albus TaxID=43700 RepID=A0A3Q3J6E0_MONAL